MDKDPHVVIAGGGFVVDTDETTQSNLIFYAVLPAHEGFRRDFEEPEFHSSKVGIAQRRFDCELLGRRDFEAPEFRLLKVVIARRRFDCELLGFCPLGTPIQHVGL
jgi:hypothetical protein